MNLVLWALPLIMGQAVCPDGALGNGQCDRLCITVPAGFDSSDCGAFCPESCTTPLLTNSACDSECALWQCGFDSSTCAECSPGCPITALGNNVCDSVCNIEQCNFDSGDCANISNPFEVVIAGGTVASPVNIAQEIKSLWASANHLYLLTGDFEFRSTEGVYFSNGVEWVSIGPLYCSERTIENCRTARAIVWLTPLLSSLRITHTLIISGVDFRGDISLKPDCTSPTCSYCPYLAFSESEWTNDRGEVVDIDEYAEQWRCEQYHATALLAVDGGELVLDSVSFQHIRQQLKALVLVTCGTATLRSVDFTDSMARPADNSALIVLETGSAEAHSYSCGSLLYSGGQVTALNNGYAYQENQAFSGFLYAAGALSVKVREVLFAYNYAPAAPLLHLYNFRQVQVENCTFANTVLMDFGCILLQTDLSYPIVLDSNDTSTEHRVTHVELRKLQFQNCSGADGTLVDIDMQGEPQNVQITDWRVDGSAAVNGDLLRISAKSVSARALNGGREKVVVDSMEVFVYFPPHFTTLTNVAILRSAAASLLRLDNLPNLSISLLNISQCGDRFAGVKEWAVAAFSNNPQLYSLGRVYTNAIVCQEFAAIGGVNVYVGNSSVVDCVCEDGVAGIELQSSSLTVDAVTVTSTRGSALLQVHTRTGSISRYQCAANTNDFATLALCIDIRSAEELIVADSAFLGNRGGTAVVALLQNVRTARFQRIAVTSNSAKYAAAGVMFVPLISGLSVLEVINSTFAHNTAANYGMLALHDYNGVLSGNTVAVVRLTAINCNFTDIKTTAQGAGITINNYVQITDDSLVQNCSFTSCSSQRGGAMYLSFQTGVITIQSSLFDSCGAPEGGAAVFAHQYPQTTVETYVKIVNSTVQRTKVGSAVFLSGYDGSQIRMESYGNLFHSNLNSAWLLNAGNLTDSASVYRNNSNTDGGAFVLKSSKFVLSNATATDNRAVAFGGFMLLTSSSTATILRSVVRRSTAGQVGGAVYADQTSTLSIEGSDVSENIAGSRGSAFYFFTSTLTLTQVSLTLNNAKGYASMLLTETKCTMRNVTFAGNFAAMETAGIVLTSSNLTIADSQFRQQTSDNGAFLQAQNDNVISIVKSLFEDGIARYKGGAIYASLRNNITVADSVVRRCGADEDGGAFYVGNSDLVLQRVTISQTTAKVDGGGIFSFSGTLIISDSDFTGVTGSSVYGADMNSVSIAGTRVADGTGTLGAGVYLQNTSSSTLQNCVFRNLAARNAGGAVYALSDGLNPTAERLVISACYFEGNTAEAAGAVAVESVSSTVSQCFFTGNTAQTDAGALQFACSNRANCVFQVANSHFASNTAVRKGGAVLWPSVQPQFLGNVYANNTAFYGPDIASFPVTLRGTANTSELALSEVPSGQTFPSYIELGLFDHSGQLVRYDSASIVELSVGNSSDTSLSGNVKAKAEKGTFTLRGFTAVGEPGSVQVFLITVKSAGHEVIPPVTVTLSFRACEPGESQYSNQCLPCPSETYSFDPALPCQLCPSEAVCYGNFTMVPKEGYWRASIYTDVFIKCLREEACVGSPPPPELSLMGQCGEGYSGNLCDTCVSGFSRSQAYSCARCPPTIANVVICLLVMAFLALITYALITSALSALGPSSSQFSVYLKALLNYGQMIVVAATLDLSWPYLVQTFLDKELTIGNFAEQLFSFECIVEDLKGSTHDMFSVKLGTLAVLPAGLMMVAALCWLLCRAIRPLASVMYKVQCSAVVILFLLHPTLSRNSFSVFACLELSPSKYYMLSDMSVQCWQATHQRIVLLLAVPCIVVWVLGLPALVLIAMLRHQHAVADESALRYAFLSTGFTERLRWWEFAILARKVLMICASVFLVAQAVQTQALTILAVLLCALLAQVYARPFVTQALNTLEVKSILLSAGTIYAGLFYSTKSVSKG